MYFFLSKSESDVEEKASNLDELTEKTEVL
jgi:hypothetical protein